MKGINMLKYKKSTINFTISLILALLLLSCAALEEFAKISKPTLNIQKVRFSGMTFDKLDMVFDIKIHNPNPLSIKLAGLDYDLKINNTSFLQGNKENQLVIEANGESKIEIPLSLGFKDIYNTFQTLKNQDSSQYNIITRLYFDLPILGRTPLTISKSGNIPLIKLPKIKVASLKLKHIGLSGANLELKLGLTNPNSFNLLLKQLNYNFSINGKNWANGKLQQQLNLKGKKDAGLVIPISLDFFKMGQTVYSLLQGDKNLNYQFNSDLDIKTSVPLIGEVKIPIAKSGTISIIK